MFALCVRFMKNFSNISLSFFAAARSSSNPFVSAFTALLKASCRKTFLFSFRFAQTQYSSVIAGPRLL